jgi:uncharacterized repeat protein (TIGR03803 family)
MFPRFRAPESNLGSRHFNRGRIYAMQSKRISLHLTATLAMFAAIMFATVTRVSAQESILHSFGSSSDGAEPSGSLIVDASGNLYGMTSRGGSANSGTVFKLTPKTGGGWREKVLYSFLNNHQDGTSPGGSLVLDAKGRLYGTTTAGGSNNTGTVFKLTLQIGGVWKETVLHTFPNVNDRKDGIFPNGGLIFDASGNLYGVTGSGGTRGNGTVFELVPKSGGRWTEKILHNFTQGDKTDGRFPNSKLIFDAAGNLYGTTRDGGGGVCYLGCGTVFKLSQSGGVWSETILHRFQNDGEDGYQPYGDLIIDASGNLYGTTAWGGGPVHQFFGTVFELTPQTGGTWAENILYSFGNQGKDGERPFGGVVLDGAGNLYGTTFAGGTANFLGTVFKLAPQTGGGWTQTLLHSFKAFNQDGTGPRTGLVIDEAGNLFGTTLTGGGKANMGTVFEITH